MKKKQHSRQDKTTAEILAQNARWMRWAMLAFVVYIISIQKEIPIQVPPSIKNKFITEAETPLAPPPNTTNETPNPPTIFKPSRTIVTQGTGDLSARCGDKVTVTYIIQGDKIDSPQKAIEPFTFTLGDPKTPTILGQIVDNMKKGEVRQIILDQKHLHLLNKSHTGSAKTFAINLTMLDLSRSAPTQQSHCTIGSKWKNTIEFR